MGGSGNVGRSTWQNSGGTSCDEGCKCVQRNQRSGKATQRKVLRRGQSHLTFGEQKADHGAMLGEAVGQRCTTEVVCELDKDVAVAKTAAAVPRRFWCFAVDDGNDNADPSGMQVLVGAENWH